MPDAELPQAIARWLRDCQQPDGRILDPVHQEHGTYAAGFASLTFGLMAAHTGNHAWQAACERSLQAALRRPIESEFDQLALLLLALHSESGSLRPRVPRLYYGRRLVSNNWVAMRALNYALRARLTGSDDDAVVARRLWNRVLGWQMADGLFVDSPGGEATPSTYHAKFCAMLALAVTETGLGWPELNASLRKGLDALCALVSPSGALVPYGRSRGTLFGCAAAILALRRGSRIFHQQRYSTVAGLLEQRLAHFQRPDGHIPCVLNDGETERRDWDVYVNNPDYNAYAAALLLLASEDPRVPIEVQFEQGREPLPPAGLQVENGGSAPHIVRLGPLLVIRGDGLFAAFVIEGQSVPLGTPFFCDHRYYGMQPLWIERQGVPLFQPTPYRWRGGEERRALVDPAENAWVPYVAVRGDHYCVRHYEQVEIRVQDSHIEITAGGVPEAYAPLPRWHRGARALLGRATGRPRPVFRARPLRGVRLRRQLKVNSNTGAFQFTTAVDGTLPGHASLHQLTGSWSPESR